MGKGWKKAGMIEHAQKKGVQFTKMAKEIAVAARLGGPELESNPRLRMAVQAAKSASCPKDTIERAIGKGAGLGTDASQIEEVLYEGFGPHQIGVLVLCQTDNRHRTAPEIRQLFKKHKGNLGEIGSVSWMFHRVFLIEALKTSVSDVEAEAIEVGADEVETDGEFSYFYGLPEGLDEVRSLLAERGWNIRSAELFYKTKNLTELAAQHRDEVVELLQALQDHDDCHRVYATISY